MLVLAGCGPLPRGGPTTSMIMSRDPAADLQLVGLTTDIALNLREPERRGFTRPFLEATAENGALIGPGDTLSVSIWESVEDGLFSSGGGQGVLEALTVDENGSIFVPYVGLVQASGRTAGALREVIRQRLEARTLSPEVDVRRIEQRSRSVSVQGQVTSQGIYPIEPPADRLLPMIAAAGGAVGEPSQLEVVLRRGPVSARARLEDLYERADLNVAIHGSDVILVRPIRHQYFVLGAVRRPGRFDFGRRETSLLDALGETGGLADEQADPRGVFIFRRDGRAEGRYPTPATEQAELAATPAPQFSSTVYHLDMTRPEALCGAGQFALRDGDLVYVSNAPFTDARKVLSIILPSVGFAGSVSNLATP
jgi:polysaccharide biosynthesis/export protein